MVGFKDKLLFCNNKKEMTKDLEFFNRHMVGYFMLIGDGVWWVQVIYC